MEVSQIISILDDSVIESIKIDKLNNWKGEYVKSTTGIVDYIDNSLKFIPYDTKFSFSKIDRDISYKDAVMYTNFLLQREFAISCSIGNHNSTLRKPISRYIKLTDSGKHLKYLNSIELYYKYCNITRLLNNKLINFIVKLFYKTKIND